MHTKRILMAVFAVGVLMLAGCSSDYNPTSSLSEDTIVTRDRGTTMSLAIPGDAVLESATLFVYVNQQNGFPVGVHRVTADWEESSVTWANFGGAFDLSQENTFMSDGIDWRSTDITPLVSAWLGGAHPNFGVLLKQDVTSFPFSIYNSRENVANNPYLRICYSVDGVETCEDIPAVADAYIWELFPDDNYGSHELLYTGSPSNIADREKQSLIRFVLEMEPPDDQEGCSHTIGYWKTHAGFGPQDDAVTPLLGDGIWLGNAGGEHSIHVTSAAMVVQILSFNGYGKQSNGISKLYAQLLGAKLSVLDGASDTDIAEAIQEADNFLADHHFSEWGSLSKGQKGVVLDWKDTFDAYNNGLIGPGHCD